MPPMRRSSRISSRPKSIKCVELGFLRKLKPTEGGALAGGANYEVRRILRAFVDAQWLGEFDARLAVYRAQFADSSPAEDERQHG